jgi:hypothetical protein
MWLDKTCRIPGIAFASILLFAGPAFAHGISGDDAAYVAESAGANIVPFFYLGAKHMVTGYDHLLFILGVIFFLYRLKHVALYVTMFSLGHSLTLLTGVLANIHVDPYLVDAAIGLSVVYKALDNLGAFKTWFGAAPDTRIAVLGFGLVHGFGLATKLQALNLSKDGLIANLISFNVGVEIGQLLALGVMLALMIWWRGRREFQSQAVFANATIMAAGFALIGFQLAGYFTQGSAA